MTVRMASDAGLPLPTVDYAAICSTLLTGLYSVPLTFLGTPTLRRPTVPITYRIHDPINNNADKNRR